ncbi:aspartate aminotransferase family protein [Fulvivirga sp. 29W222]|uniref:Aspartate aminotransferase family protein n=1 Tax=Fulvivirga marina TaxID=2494733 RepID=A0A937G0X1_9BACT|nr:aminotransferase class III-fold pyridoxal phosphate-dependent enzyme [Fulvivirga marina]MBL6448058.1 aspartate aminotransferase family protein [Fulvivirga marina]
MKLFKVYPQLDLELTKAQGCYIYDRSGAQYLDLYGGHAVISVGHTHPHYVKRIKEQLDAIAYYSNAVINPVQHSLLDKLGKISGYDAYQLFLCNSGAEAIENALKIASFHTQKDKLVAFNKSFHGRTSRALSVTDNDKYRSRLDKYSNVQFLEMNLNAVESALKNQDVCAVLIEGIQGLAGIYMPEADFLPGLKQLCEKYGALLVVDEIQSGYGRSGKFFAHQHADVQPDLITVAKGMANGFPMGGVLISPKIEGWFGMSGSTFGGNHLACVAALATLEIIENEKLVENAQKVGAELIEALRAIPEVKEVRGAGLMIGVEFDFPVKDIRENLMKEQHVLTGMAANPNVIRLLPPLTLTQEQAALFVEKLKLSIQKISSDAAVLIGK